MAVKASPINVRMIGGIFVNPPAVVFEVIRISPVGVVETKGSVAVLRTNSKMKLAELDPFKVNLFGRCVTVPQNSTCVPSIRRY